MHTDKLTTKCHICMHTWKQGGLMCGIWDWQSTIVKDLNDSKDPKHTLICRENAFVAIYALFSDNKCPLFTRLGGGFAQSGHCPLFLPFFLHDGFPNYCECFFCTCSLLKSTRFREIVFHRRWLWMTWRSSQGCWRGRKTWIQPPENSSVPVM